MKKYCIGNTHFDPVWLWRWPEAMASIRATFRAALERMEENPDFVYSFATPPVFAWIKATDPALFEAVREKTAEGRWELGEGWWLQPDCYSASGESYVRQGLYGQRWLMENFGKTADTVFNIDSFGHSPMLPQILTGCGIQNYCFVRPEVRHVPLASPLFWWESPNGSRVLTYRADGCYAKDMADRLSYTPVVPVEYCTDELVVYGVTDHGGAPTKEALRDIHACPDAFCSTLTRYFEEHRDCPYTEKREFITGDFGVYANLPKIKAMVRRGEYTLLAAEKAAVLAEMAGCPLTEIEGRPVQEILTRSWQDVLFNQFHDIIGGASILDAYEDAYAGLGRAVTGGQEVLHYALQRMTSGLRMIGDAWNLAVWNLHGTAYDGYIEAEVQWIHEYDWYSDGIELEDGDGNRYPCQIIREKSVLPGFRSRFLFRAVIPPMGYRLFHVTRTGEKVQKREANPERIETDKLTVTLENGCIARVQDKNSRILAENLFTPATFRDDGDTWAFNIPAYDKEPIPWENLSVEVKEAGPLRTVIRSHFRQDLSTLTLYYTIYHDENTVDLRWTCSWNDRHKAVKLLCGTVSPKHFAAVPYGSVSRDETAADVPLGPWLQTDRYTLLADGSFAYNLQEGQLGVTLFRSPIAGDLRIFPIDPEDDYDFLGQGVNEGRMRICFDPVSPAEAYAAADHFLDPPVVIDEAWHPGIDNPEHSFVQVENGSAALTVLKQTEEGNGLILRLAEYNGIAETVTLRFGDAVYTVEMKPYEIKTLKLAGTAMTEVSMLEI